MKELGKVVMCDEIVCLEVDVHAVVNPFFGRGVDVGDDFGWNPASH